MSGFHQSFPTDRKMRATVARPTAFALPEGLHRTLITFLKQFDFVSAAYLAQFTYSGDVDPRVGNRPCLTVGVAIDRPDREQLVTEISRQSGSVLSGNLGDWHFIDFQALTPATERAFQNAFPLFTRQ
jgi:hypothetical protein